MTTTTTTFVPSSSSKDVVSVTTTFNDRGFIEFKYLCRIFISVGFIIQLMIVLTNTSRTTKWFYTNLFSIGCIVWNGWIHYLLSLMCKIPTINPDSYYATTTTTHSSSSSSLSSSSNNPNQNCENQKKHTKEPQPPTLLCIGDSLTHGVVSSNYVTILSSKLAITTSHNVRGIINNDNNSDNNNHHHNDHQNSSHIMNVVNGGQNGITSYTILTRIHALLEKVEPDYITILIGTNDIITMHCTILSDPIIKNNHLPMKPTLLLYESNLKMILQIIREYTLKTKKRGKKVCVAICTIPPCGEDDMNSEINTLVKDTNQLIEKIVHDEMTDQQQQIDIVVLPVFQCMESVIEKKRYKKSNVQEAVKNVEMDIIKFCALFNMIYYACFGYVSRSYLSGKFKSVLFKDSIHLNEKGASIVANLIVEWLVTKNVL